MRLRIYADFNSGGSRGHGPCWLLRYGKDMRRVDDLVSELRLFPGMKVTLYHTDDLEEFEVDATLEEHPESDFARWQALPDWDTKRQLRG